MDNQIKEKEQLFLGSGWAFPVTFSDSNHQLQLTSYEANIRESINIILKTNMGERCLEPQFGSGLQKFFFRKMDDVLIGEIRDAVELSLLNNEPRITVKDVQVEIADRFGGIVEISIEYVFNQTNTRHNYVHPFHLIEGTNL